MGFRKLVLVALLLVGSCVLSQQYVQAPSSCVPCGSITRAGQFVIPAIIKPILQPDCLPVPAPVIPSYPDLSGGFLAPFGGMPPIILDDDKDDNNNLLYWLILLMSRQGGFGRCGGYGGGGGGSCGGGYGGSCCNSCGGCYKNCGCGNSCCFGCGNNCESCNGCCCGCNYFPYPFPFPCCCCTNGYPCDCCCCCCNDPCCGSTCSKTSDIKVVFQSQDASTQ